nr:MAG TPA: hypothetical protein [Caudoviricetes sp.]
MLKSHFKGNCELRFKYGLYRVSRYRLIITP